MSLKRFQRALAVWVWGLIGGSIGGALSSVVSWLTTSGLNSAGVPVQRLDFNTVKVIFAVSLLTHGVAYYMKSPMPPLQFDDTTPPFPNADNSNVKPQNKTE